MVDLFSSKDPLSIVEIHILLGRQPHKRIFQFLVPTRDNAHNVNFTNSLGG